MSHFLKLYSRQLLLGIPNKLIEKFLPKLPQPPHRPNYTFNDLETHLFEPDVLLLLIGLSKQHLLDAANIVRKCNLHSQAHPKIIFGTQLANKIVKLNPIMSQHKSIISDFETAYDTIESA